MRKQEKKKKKPEGDMQVDQSWFEIVKRGSLRDVRDLLFREGTAFLEAEHREHSNGFLKTWTPLGVALERGESGTDIAVLLLANGADHGRVCASCVTDSQPLSLEHRGPSFGSTLSTSLFGPYVASLQSARVDTGLDDQVSKSATCRKFI